jgi:hypothetical protein
LIKPNSAPLIVDGMTSPEAYKTNSATKQKRVFF